MIRLTREQVREVDRQAIGRYGIPGVVLMENAARAVAAEAARILGRLAGRRIAIVCGGGNNGGDGLAAARHLHNAGADVRLFLTIDPARYEGDALVNWRIVQRMNLPVGEATPAAIGQSGAALVIDAIFGTGLSAPPREPFAAIAQAINELGRQGVPVLAVDLPSGLDCDTGRPLGPCVVASHTVTFVAEKVGFAQPGARAYTGEVTVGDIGCPAELLRNDAMTKPECQNKVE